MKHLKYIALALLAAVSITAQAGSYTVGVEGHNYLPISSADGGNYKGYARDLLDAFAEKYGHTFTYKPMPVNRLLDEFIGAKSVDFKFPDNAYWAADAKKGVTITYSKGVVAVTEGAMVLPASKGKPVTSLATMRGFTPFPFLDAIKSKKVTVSEANTTDAVISMVEAGRASAGYLGVLSAVYTMEEVLKKPGMLEYDSSAPHSVSDFSLATLKHIDVIKQMDEFLVKEKDTVARLKAKYKIKE